MLTRQESVMTSSSPRRRRENVPRQSSIGCMAGVFHFISKYHSRRRFLTSGKKQESDKQRNNLSTRKCKSNTKQENKNSSIHKTPKTETETETSAISRSPALPPEIRKQITAVNTKSSPPVAEEEAAETERRNIVEALEKCDEDLKAISSIINTLRSNDKDLSTSHDPVISVLRFLNRSPTLDIDRSSRDANIHVLRNGGVLQPKKPQARKNFFEKVTSRVLSAPTTKIPKWSSKAKIESVDEVCNDLVWGIKRELGKIGLVLENHIFLYLIDEFVKDLIGDFAYVSLPVKDQIIRKPRNPGVSYTDMDFVFPPLPLEACKRKLSF